AASGKEMQYLSGSANPVNSVAFDPGGRWLYAGERTGWNLESGRGEKLIDGVPAGQNVLSEDGRTLAVVNGRNTSVGIWDVASKKHVLDLNPGGGSIAQSVALSRDGQLAAVSYQWGSAESEKFMVEMQKPPDSKQIRKQAEERDRKQKEDLIKAMS